MDPQGTHESVDANNHSMATQSFERPSEITSTSGAHPDLELGRTFARSLASKDFSTIERLLHPNLTFRGLTPGEARYLWESHEPRSVVTDILQQWSEETDHIESLERLEDDRDGDRNRVAYRLSGSNSSMGKFVVEQQAYDSVVDGKISWMSVVCSGFRPG